MTQHAPTAGRRDGPYPELPKVAIGPFWHDPTPFPRDPNAPPSPSDRAPRPLPAIEAPAVGTQNADQLQRELAQLRLIGPSPGAELRRIDHRAETAPRLGL
jgi:hypothetical protein